MTSTLIQADLLRWLRDNQWLVQNGYIPKAHAVIGDPPYGLEFMGKEWDKPKPAGRFHVPAQENRVFNNASGHFFDNMNKPLVRLTAGVDYQHWVTEWATLLLDYVYPGAVLALFGGTRTYHRLASGLEDAGWEVFDCMMYLYGSGFPKAADIGKLIDKSEGAEREIVGTTIYADGKTRPNNWTVENSNDGWKRPAHKNYSGDRFETAPVTPAAQQWDGYKTALKPAYEPIVLARAPRGNATYAELAQQYGTGALNVDGGRIGTETWTRKGGNNSTPYGSPVTWNVSNTPDIDRSATGRYPANLALDEDAARALDQMSGELTSGGITGGGTYQHDLGGGYGMKHTAPMEHRTIGDSGGASRFFYTAKAAAWEREAGLADFVPTIVNDGRDTPIDNAYQRGDSLRRNTHPTVKPIQLITWLATLLLPPPLDVPRRVLVPFAGSGSEMIGAQLAGWDEIVGIEREAEYCAINEARRRWWVKFKTYEQAEIAYRPVVQTTDDLSDLPLFAVSE